MLLNPAPAQRLEDALLQTITYLVVNEREAAVSSGLEGEAASSRQAAEALRGRGAKTVVVTLGAKGLVWSSAEGDGQLSAHKVEVVDTTAAGDAFCGALAVTLAEGEGLEAALRFANAAGALAVTKKGAQPSLPTRDDIRIALRTQTNP